MANNSPPPLSSVLIFLFFLGNINMASAQDIETDTTQAHAYMQLAKNFQFNELEYDSAMTYYQKSLDIWLHYVGEEHYRVADCLLSMGQIYERIGLFDKSKTSLKRSIEIRLNLPSKLPSNLANSYQSIGSVCINLGEYSEGITYLHQSINVYRTITGKGAEYISNSYYKLGELYKNIGTYDSALYYMHLALDADIKNYGKDHQWVGSSHHGLGAIYASMRNYEEAQYHLDQSYRITQKAVGDSNSAIASILQGLAVVFLDQREFIQAQEYIQKALNIYKKLDHQNVGESYALNIMGGIYDGQKQYPQALKYYLEALAQRKQIFGENHPFVASTYNNISLNYLEMKEYKKAISYADSSLSLHQKISNNQKPTNLRVYAIYEEMGDYSLALKSLESALIASQNIVEKNLYVEELKTIYFYFGSVYSKLDKDEQALLYFQKVLRQYDHSLDTIDVSQNPKINPTTIDATLIETLHRKALIFQKIYVQTNQLENLKYALNTYELAIKVSDMIRSDYSRRESKELFLEEFFSLYNDAIETSILLWKHAHKKTYLKQAYLFSEKSKSILLHEAVQTTFAREKSNLPDNLLKQETSLRLFLAHFDKLLLDETIHKDQKDEERIAQLQNKVFYYRRAHDSLLQVIANDYPNYYQLMYDLEIAEAKDVQEFLAPKSALVQYFWGDSTLYTFTLTPKDISVSERALTEAFQDSIHLFIQQFAQIQQVENHLYDQAIYQTFTQHGHAIYQHLLGNRLPVNVDQLIIIPDGLLSHMPFELLLTESVGETSVDYSHLPYMINDFRIRYEYSSTLLKPQSSRKKGEKYFAGFAPTYDRGYEYLAEASYYKSFFDSYLNLREGLSPLRYNQPEVEQIAAMFNGDAFIGNQATEAQFKANSNNYRLLHLAMHTVLDDSLPLYSGLVFTQQEDSLEDGYLYTSEIYNLSLKADLAILSACETGLGKMLRGEGMMSLARAFKYAGTPNIVTSLWKVDDEATQQLMQHFYGHLQSGMPKDKALQQAKLDQIAKGGKYAHPAFWSAFVLIGDHKSIQASFPWGYMVAGILLLCTFVLIGIRYDKLKVFWKR